jgi:hypothetical protein
MFPRASLLALALAAVASAQQIGTLTAESHPKLTASTVGTIYAHAREFTLMTRIVHDRGRVC